MTKIDPVKSTISLCSKYYTDKTFKHCVRVAKYAYENPMVVDSDIVRNAIYLIALCHDLLEDTDVTIEEIKDATCLDEKLVVDTMNLLTKRDNETYVEYIKKLRNSKNPCAYIVKIADMKDHLQQTETLTDILKEKYWEALPYLL